MANEASGNHFTGQEILNQSMGQCLFDVQDGSGTLTPPTGSVYVAIMVDADATFEAVQDDVNSETTDNLPSAARGAGRIVYGRFTSVTVTSGTVIAYRSTQGQVA